METSSDRSPADDRIAELFVVPSLTMQQYKEAFQKHEKKGVVGYFHEVPHEIVADALKSEHDRSAELQWHHMVLVSNLDSKGWLTTCIAMCVLSSSVEKALAGAAITLGILISELSQESWKGWLITFDTATHQLHMVRGASLVDKLRPLAAVRAPEEREPAGRVQQDPDRECGGQAGEAYDGEARVCAERHGVRRVGRRRGWVLEHEAIRKRFVAEGLVLPGVVFWNVGMFKASIPVVAAHAGV